MYLESFRSTLKPFIDFIKTRLGANGRHFLCELELTYQTMHTLLPAVPYM